MSLFAVVVFEETAPTVSNQPSRQNKEKIIAGMIARLYQRKGEGRCHHKRATSSRTKLLYDTRSYAVRAAKMLLEPEYHKACWLWLLATTTCSITC